MKPGSICASSRMRGGTEPCIPLEKYDEECAVAIYENARTFMQHLASKLEG